MSNKEKFKKYMSTFCMASWHSIQLQYCYIQNRNCTLKEENFHNKKTSIERQECMNIAMTISNRQIDLNNKENHD